MTACTPATARAGAVSRDRMRAWGCGLRRVAPHTIPSIHRSEENANWPLVFARASGRSTLSPRPGARRLRVKVLGRLGAGTGALLLAGVEGGEDPAVPGAAAQVAGDGLAQRELVGVGPAVKQVVDRHDHPGDAEAALHGALLDEGALDVGQLALGAQALDGAEVAADRVGGHDAAGGDQDPVHHDRAGPTLALLAGVLGAGKAEPLPEHVQQALPDPGVDDGAVLAVDLEPVAVGGLVGAGGGLDAHAARLLCSARMATTWTAWRRNSAVPRWSEMGVAASRASSPNLATASGGAVIASQSIWPAMNSSAAVARSGRGATDPSPSRTLRPARSTARPQTTIEITMALRVPTLRNCCGPSRRGTRISWMTSPGWIAVRFTPVMNSSIGRRRVPPRLASTRVASRAPSTGSPSPAGLAVPTLPPTVPALRICGEPTVRAAAASPGRTPARSFSISVQVPPARRCAPGSSSSASNTSASVVGRATSMMTSHPAVGREPPRPERSSISVRMALWSSEPRSRLRSETSIWATSAVTGMATPASRAAAWTICMSLWCRSTRKPGSNRRCSMPVALRSRIWLPASPPASTLMAGGMSTSWASSRTIASLTSSMIPATMSWLAALTVWPEPTGPTCTIVLPSDSRMGSAASKSSAAPPTMIERVASTAPASPPLTGASRNRTPRACAALPTRRAVSGRIVLMSISSSPWRAVDRTPSSPSTTASTSGESGTIVITTSAPAATSAAEPAALAPADTRARTGSWERLWTVSSWPARTRCSAMGLPITPRPMNPIAVIGGPPKFATRFSVMREAIPTRWVDRTPSQAPSQASVEGFPSAGGDGDEAAGHGRGDAQHLREQALVVVPVQASLGRGDRHGGHAVADPEHRHGQTADADLLLAVVDGVPLARDGVELGEEPAPVDDGPRCARRQPGTLQQRLHRRPRPEGEQDLADRGRVRQYPAPHLGEHPDAVLAGRHLRDVDGVVAVQHDQG